MDDTHQATPQFARLTRTTLRPESFDSALQRVSESSVPLTLSEPDCRGILCLANVDNHNVLIVSLWENQTGQMSATGSGEMMEDVTSFRRDWVGPLIRETYNVLVPGLPPATEALTTWHARVTSMEVRREYWAPIIQAGWLAAEQLEQQQPGYVGALGLGDPGSGRALFVELWRTRATLRASETTAYRQERTARAVRMLVGVPRHEVFQVHHYQPA
jgi:hypothetical protein